MRKSHLGLINGSADMGLPSRMSETVRAMYFDQPLALNQQVENYLAHVETLSTATDSELTADNGHLAKIVATGPSRLVISLDKIVNQYQREGEDEEEINAVLDRVLEAINQEAHLGSIKVQASASIGVTLFPDDTADPDTLIRHADQAMYLAKGAGKNCYQFFDPEHDRKLQLKRDRLKRLELALERNEFVLFYQPKVNMRSGKVIGFEALIRWQHPEKGILAPGEFLPAIENQPLSLSLGEWVLETAMTQIETWKALGLNFSVSVNIDAMQIEQPDFIDRLGQLLARHQNISSGDLELEILETSALEDIDLVMEVILACRQLGIGFALDDFGTGYSSLLYLKRLPADLLKIDRGFIRDMLDDPEDLAILEGVLGLAFAFQRRAIAEGVETEAHGEMLLRMNCNLGQGYAIARPMPAGEIEGWLSNWQPYPSWLSTKRSRRDDLPILFAMVEHRAWVVQLERYLQGESEVLPQLDDSRCRFGSWLMHDSSLNHEAHPSLPKIDSIHRAIHGHAKTLIDEKSKGRKEIAITGLGELYDLRDRLVAQLMDLLGEENPSATLPD